MRLSHSRFRPLAAAIMLPLVLSVTLSAHDFWLEPSTYAPKIGEPVRIHLRVGEHFSGEPVVRDGSRIERFVAVGPTGERPVLGRDGLDPAGLLRLDAPGLWYVGYRSKPSAVKLDARAFEQYLREEGLERIIEERAARKEATAPGREHFSRSVKTLLRSADAPADGYDRLLGLTLELVPMADPAAAPGALLPVRLLHNGAPLEGALVVAYRRDAGVAGKGEERASERTDRGGQVNVPLSPGLWLIKAVHMQRAAAGTGVDWESTWTALTFEVPATAK